MIYQYIYMGILIYKIMLSYVESSSPQRHGTIWVVVFGLFRSERQVVPWFQRPETNTNPLVLLH